MAYWTNDKAVSSVAYWTPDKAVNSVAYWTPGANQSPTPQKAVPRRAPSQNLHLFPRAGSSPCLFATGPTRGASGEVTRLPLLPILKWFLLASKTFSYMLSHPPDPRRVLRRGGSGLL